MASTMQAAGSPAPRAVPSWEGAETAGYRTYERAEWAELARHARGRFDLPDPSEVAATAQPISHDELEEVYLPLAELLALLAKEHRDTQRRLGKFLGEDRSHVPFVIGIAGSVAVGKSTTARVLQELLIARGSRHSVALLTTDGFLLPNAELERRGLMERKGFPESYDQRALVAALAAIRAGEREVVTPVYSHVVYDIVPDEHLVLRQPEVVIVEGLNVLQVSTDHAPPEHTVVSDFFDCSIYVDASEEDVGRWYEERLMALRHSVLKDPEAYFHRFSAMTDDELLAVARDIWRTINLKNLRENIAPTRSRAMVVLCKAGAHRVERVLLRRS